jgi:predicted Fe-S protein YdhL (DUF1289 family)
MISSPCTTVCVIDSASGLCSGCGRTLGEIAQWGSLSEAERRAIMASLPERMRENRLAFAVAKNNDVKK